MYDTGDGQTEEIEEVSKGRAFVTGDEPFNCRHISDKQKQMIVMLWKFPSYRNNISYTSSGRICFNIKFRLITSRIFIFVQFNYIKIVT